MPPTDSDRLNDILESIDEIDAMLAGLNLDQFTKDKMRRMATERYLEVVCEASRKLSDKLKRANPHIDWRKMIDFGNRLRHAYRTMNIAIVWGIVENQLPLLKKLARQELGKS